MSLLGRCKHQWQILDKTTMPSQLEVIHSSGLEIKEGAHTGMMKQRLVLTLHCTACGKLHQTAHTTADWHTR